MRLATSVQRDRHGRSIELQLRGRLPVLLGRLQLNRAFVKIGDAKVRRKIVDLVKALAAEADSE